ncbi:AER018W-Ap [Eremothecium gossypii ATCC 10895]|uniref:AER018W-Ap n=1 Tax=Eremothecium gossypii (strain ATCC 10895 / CBS 109.51 / FGSC 9923 / NRRL Y-1056) TaxID=284811 RepID=D8FGD3_EREGS|nr:AER018W-Ap [Eremothecium gossypii ATCC 10895]ADJ41776.1 AER018W-Ap [Eremothecium gossypii ATCC 10895]
MRRGGILAGIMFVSTAARWPGAAWAGSILDVCGGSTAGCSADGDIHNALLDPVLAAAQELALRTFYCEGDPFSKIYVRLKALELTTTPEDIKRILETWPRWGLRGAGAANESTLYDAILREALEAEVADLVAREEAGEADAALLGGAWDFAQDIALFERPIMEVAAAYVDALRGLKAILQEPGNVNTDVVRAWINDWFVKSPMMFRLALLQIKSSAKRMALERKYRRYYLQRILTGAWFYVDITHAAQRLFGEYRTGFDDVYPEVYNKFLHNLNSSFVEEFNSFYRRPNFASESPTDGDPQEIMFRMLEYSLRGVFALKEPMATCFLGVAFVSAHDECYKCIVNTSQRELVLMYKLITMYMSMKTKSS